MLKKSTSVTQFFSDHVIPMLRHKLGGGWRRLVKYYNDTKRGEYVLKFTLDDDCKFADITGALFNLARACGVELRLYDPDKKFGMAVQPA